jgi:hypothetical protein
LQRPWFAARVWSKSCQKLAKLGFLRGEGRDQHGNMPTARWSISACSSLTRRSRVTPHRPPRHTFIASIGSDSPVSAFLETMWEVCLWVMKAGNSVVTSTELLDLLYWKGVIYYHDIGTRGCIF